MRDFEAIKNCSHEELVKFASYASKYKRDYSPRERAIIASEIEKRASVVGMKVDHAWISCYGMMSKTAACKTAKDFSRKVEKRREHCSVKGIKKVAGLDVDSTLLNIKNNTANLTPHDLAEALFQFDKLAGLDEFYDTRFSDPIDTVFGDDNGKWASIKLASYTDLRDCDLNEALKDDSFVKTASLLIGEKAAEDLKNDPSLFWKKDAVAKDIIINLISESK